MLDFLPCTAKEIGTVAGKITNLAGSILRLETRLQQTVTVEQHQPFSIRLIRLLLRDILHFPGIAQLNIEAVLLELEEQWYPVDASGLHRHGIDTASLQPIADFIQVTGKASEAAIVLAIPACGDAYLHLRICDVYACCVRVHNFQFNSFARVQFFSFLCHRK